MTAKARCYREVGLAEEVVRVGEIPSLADGDLLSAGFAVDVASQLPSISVKLKKSGDTMDLGIALHQVSLFAALEVAKKVLSEAEALEQRVSVAVTDGAGHLIVGLRMDGRHAATLEYARKKAYFSARSGNDTESYLRDRLERDEMLWRALNADPELFLTPGGAPLFLGQELVGGVGVSGAPYTVDAALALSGAQHLENISPTED